MDNLTCRIPVAPRNAELNVTSLGVIDVEWVYPSQMRYDRKCLKQIAPLRCRMAISIREGSRPITSVVHWEYGESDQVGVALCEV
jgi:hypothetical protein